MDHDMVILAGAIRPINGDYPGDRNWVALKRADLKCGEIIYFSEVFFGRRTA